MKANNQNLLPKDGLVWLDPNFLEAAYATMCFETLKATLAFREFPVRIFGKWIMQPRLVAWYGKPGAAYQYSGVKLEPLALTPLLLELLKQVNAAAGMEFNGVLVNYYRHGNDSMGWHSDDETELGPNPVIASLSLGAARKFSLQHKSEPHQKLHMELSHGSLLLMAGATQHHWKHALPKTQKPVSGRINLTFRKVF